MRSHFMSIERKAKMKSSEIEPSYSKVNPNITYDYQRNPDATEFRRFHSLISQTQKFQFKLPEGFI